MTINEVKLATFLAPSAAGRELKVSRDWVRTLIKTGRLSPKQHVESLDGAAAIADD